MEEKEKKKKKKEKLAKSYIRKSLNKPEELEIHQNREFSVAVLCGAQCKLAGRQVFFFVTVSHLGGFVL